MIGLIFLRVVVENLKYVINNIEIVSIVEFCEISWIVVFIKFEMLIKVSSGYGSISFFVGINFG